MSIGTLLRLTVLVTISKISNIKQHKIGASIADGAGLVLDVAAAIIPIVPGGAGTAIKTVRTGDRVGSINDIAFLSRKQKIHGNSIYS